MKMSNQTSSRFGLGEWIWSCAGRSAALLLVLIILTRPAIADDAVTVDLGAKYPATLDHSPQPKGYPWSCTERDVWQLSGFAFELRDSFQIELKSAQVAFGQHDSNVLWAAVFPDQPGTITNASAGKGEQISSVWLRFHPSRLAELFPTATVLKQGDPDIMGEAQRLALHKMRTSWQAGGQPMIPSKESLVVDLETTAGPRRFFAIDTTKSTVQYIDAFEARPLPKAKQIDQETAQQIFDLVWNTFDREYAMFVVKPDVNWEKLRDEFRPTASATKSNQHLGRVLARMLAHLQDLHIDVEVDGTSLLVYERSRPLNANIAALPSLVGKLQTTKSNLGWAITKDGIGYVIIDRLTDPKLPEVFAQVLPKLESTRALIVDLRYNGGGDELLARGIAGLFLDKERVYSHSQYRQGPMHNDLTEPFAQSCPVKDPWQYVAPVVVLQGQRTMSSAESFVLMMAQAPQVTTLGDRTAGSSGNPKVLEAGAGIRVKVPRWNPLDAQRKPFDAVGISPQVEVTTASDDFRENRDPVLSQALERLRKMDKFEGPAIIIRPGADRPKR